MLRIRIDIKIKIQEQWMLKGEQWRAADILNGGVEVQNGPVKGSADQWLQVCITLMRSSVQTRIHIKGKTWIQIRITVRGGIRIRIIVKG